MSGPLTVTGGAGGVAAHLDDMRAAAGVIGSLDRALAELAADCHRRLLDLDLAASAVLDPLGAAEVELALLAAVDGPRGLTAAAVRLSARGAQLELAARAYAAADAATSGAVAAAAHARNVAVAGLLAATFPQAAAAAGAWVVTEELSGGDAPASTRRWLARHPMVVSEAVRTGPPVADLAGLAGLLYPEGPPVVTYLGDSGDNAVAAAGVADLVRALAARDRTTRGRHQGEIEVRVIRSVSGRGEPRAAAIVYIPGTKDWHLTRPGCAVNDFASNLHAMAGDGTTYERGVLAAAADALARSGAAPGTPVMLVGHSLGGMVAVRAAGTAAAGHPVQVTTVVTTGAPVGAFHVPADVQVLQLQNSADVVARLDGQPDPDLPNRIQATFTTERAGMGANHSLQAAYLPAAVAVDRSSHPSLVAFREHAARFLPTAPGDQSDVAELAVTTHVYRVRRASACG